MDNITKFPPLHLLPEKNAQTIEPTRADFPLHNLSIVGDLAEMKAKMLADVFVLDGVALLGQLTVIYAKPNAGKQD